jgi:hypothetical protein
MSSWQRRKAAVDRRLTFQATNPEPSRSAGYGNERAGAAGSAPSAATRLAALLREEQRVAADDPVVLAGTA